MTVRGRVVVVGAGVAGLTAARRLRRDHDVVVVDKGRGVGGRLATRRIGAATLDHGAQFLTTHTDEFATTVAAWAAVDVVRPWFHGQVGPAGVAGTDGHPRYRGAATMSAVAKHLADGLEVRLATRVTSIERTGPTWTVRTEDGWSVIADAVVLTAPVPQALELLAAGSVTLAPAEADALGRIRYDPCLTLLAPLVGPAGLPEPGAVAPDAGPVDWAADNEIKGVSTVPAVTVHADAAFSEAHWGSADDVVAAELLAAIVLASPPIAEAVQVQRWRYARPTVIHPERRLVIDGPAPLVVAGDAFGGAKVEGAALSGAAAADTVARLLDGRDPEEDHRARP